MNPVNPKSLKTGGVGSQGFRFQLNPDHHPVISNHDPRDTPSRPVRALGSRGLSQVGGRGARRRARAEAHIRRARAEAHIRRARRSGVAGGSGGATRRGSRRRAGPCTVAVGKPCPRLPQAGTLIDDRANPPLPSLVPPTGGRRPTDEKRRPVSLTPPAAMVSGESFAARCQAPSSSANMHDGWSKVFTFFGKHLAK